MNGINCKLLQIMPKFSLSAVLIAFISMSAGPDHLTSLTTNNQYFYAHA